MGPSIADAYDYVTYGVCYATKNVGDKREALISFHGLLMKIETADFTIEQDDRVYCLMRKVKA